MIRDIVAVDERGGMAKGGKTPWFIPEDLTYFHEQSKRFGGNLLIGRGTYEAMKKGLVERHGVGAWPPAGRHLYVLTSHDLPDETNVTIVHSLEKFSADMAAAGNDVWNGSIAESQTRYTLLGCMQTTTATSFTPWIGYKTLRLQNRGQVHQLRLSHSICSKYTNESTISTLDMRVPDFVY